LTSQVVCCRRAAELLYEYAEGSLDGELRGLLDGHLAKCAPCRALANTYAATVRMSMTMRWSGMPQEVSVRLHVELERRISAG